MVDRSGSSCLRVSLLVALAFLTLPATSVCGMQTQTAEETATEHIEEFLQSADEAGFAAAVWADGKIIWSREWGFSNRETRDPVDEETMFRIGSVTKVITATALCVMVENDELTLNSRLGDYLPSAPKHLHPITTRQLACHLSGIRHYDPNRIQEEYMSNDHFDNQRAAMKIFQSDALLSHPGEDYLYSTYGYTALGAIMESASETPFVEILRERIYRPSGMEHTFGEHNEEVRGQMAVPYGEVNGQVIEYPKVDISNKLAGGGLVSTPRDLARFMGALVENRIVSEETLEMMMEKQHTDSGKATPVGIGWRVAKDSRGRRLMHHGGSAPGGRAFVLVYPDHKVAVAMCMNLASHTIRFDEDLALPVVLGFLNR